ncbi:MAG: Methionine--tRNA ligase [Lentisphaerae bacterium ADurb.BinA184]|nr:MAG: Methionine--tRNA ligase [Lentisphaerae bacterium ADurb.BinA184]
MNSSNPSFYVTTPIYYVNDRPHIGHAYTTILADVLARYYRLLGVPTHFLTGTDEHGQKVYEAALRNRLTPIEQCDRTVVRFQELWKKLDITHDDFIRTTEPRHTRVVQRILQELYDRGEIYAADYAGWYCVPCERFFPDKDLAEGNCPECHRPVERLTEKNYFFRMSRYQDWLVAYIQEHPEFIQPASRRQETLGFLRQPLGDLCISRPKKRMGWGIDLPFDADYVTYVWFDALVNYISAVGYLADEARFRAWWPASCHLIGKDILTTHTVYWPTMLKAMGVEMPRAVFAHGWWLVGRDKMSKSLGNVVNPMDMAERYGVDAFRYFLLAEMTLGQDASFTEEAFRNRYNADLANDLGNLASRVLKMVVRNLDGALPAIPPRTADEEGLIATTLGAVGHMRNYLGSMQLDRGVAETIQAVREGNRYFDRMAPWQMVKAGDTAGLQRVLYSAAECLRIVSGLLFPIMPSKMTELRRALGLTETAARPRVADLATWGGLPAGTRLQDPGSLFPRIEAVAEKGGAVVAEPAAPAAPAPAPAVNVVTIEEFGKVALRTARVLAAEAVPKATKLLRLEIELGGETRQIVAGIAQFYKPEQLVGRTIVVVANLKPAVIRGLESNGMLLAAKSGDTLRLVTPDGDVPSGSSVG